MAEQATKRNVSLTISRTRIFPTPTAVTTGFRLRLDKTTSLIDVFLELAGQKGVRIILDPVIIRSNNEFLSQFAAAVAIDPDENAIRDDIATSENIIYANVVHMSRVGDRGETVFGCLSLFDWVNETRQGTRKNGEVGSVDVVVASSTAAFQKKLILEIALLIDQINKAQ